MKTRRFGEVFNGADRGPACIQDCGGNFPYIHLRPDCDPETSDPHPRSKKTSVRQPVSRQTL
jgi:hypothetical protein